MKDLSDLLKAGQGPVAFWRGSLSLNSATNVTAELKSSRGRNIVGVRRAGSAGSNRQNEKLMSGRRLHAGASGKAFIVASVGFTV